MPPDISSTRGPLAVAIEGTADDQLGVTGSPLVTSAEVGGAAISVTNPLPTYQGKPSTYSVVHKFGSNTAIANGVIEAIWDGSSAYTYAGSGAIPTVQSAQSGDTSIPIVVIGTATSGGAEVSQTITTDASDGTTPVSGTTSVTRVYRAYTSGSTATTGAITIKIGATTVAIVSVVAQQTLMALYTVPTGKQAYIWQWDVTVGGSQATDLYLSVREPSGVFRARSVLSDVTGAVRTEFWSPYAPGMGPYAAGSDIEARAKGAGGSTTASSLLTIVLEDV